MPTTRSQGSHKRKRPNTPEGSNLNARAASTDSSDSEVVAKEIQGYLDNASASIRRWVEQLRELRKRNNELEEEIARLREAGETAPAGRRSTASSTAVRRLKVQVNTLEKARKKDKDKIKRLRAKEVKADADELLREAEDKQMNSDTGRHMRKLLKEFSKLMGMNVLDGENEECPVCFEKLEVKRCYSLPCNHIVCMECIKRLGKADRSDNDAELVKCPECRHEGAREDCDVVVYKAVEQWDQLLLLAAEWAPLDNSGTTETSEEEEDNFFDDGTNDTTDGCSTPANHEPNNDEVSDDDLPSEQRTPESAERSSPTSYRTLSSPSKRARMQELAARKRKK